MGFEPGPLFREIMHDLLMARLDQKIKSKEDELAFVRRRYAALSKGSTPYPRSAGVPSGHARRRVHPLKKEAVDG